MEGSVRTYAGHSHFEALRRAALSPLALIAFSLLVVRLAPAPQSGASPFLSGVLAALYLLSATAFLSACYALLRPRLEWRWGNHTLAGRVAHFVDLLSVAKRSVVIITGSLHHNLFDHDEVVCALEALPDDVRVEVFHEDPIDEKSARFKRELMRRNAEIRRIAPNQISHGMIIDSKHCKVEAFGVPDGQDHKRARYYMFAPRLARRALDQVEAVILGHAPAAQEHSAAA